VKAKTGSQNIFLHSALGAALATLCGLLLWKIPLGEAWRNASYDYSFRFGTRALTNKVAFIMMDNEAYDQFHQIRGQPWDRALHARLLNKLADDNCALVVMDCFFHEPGDPRKDEALATAMRRLRQVGLMAEESQITHPSLAGIHPLLPTEPFLSAARSNWGVGCLERDLDSTVRQIWPLTGSVPYPSLPETAARLSGAPPGDSPAEKWLRYYGRDGEWTRLSYGFALSEPTNFFRDRIVFIGNHPKTPALDGEPDEFFTPYSRWTGETSGGTEIMLATYLNLVNREWLQRPAPWIEVLVLILTGTLAGAGFSRLRPVTATFWCIGAALTVMLAAVTVSYFSNYWIPWVLIAAGQFPCALGCSLVVALVRRREAMPGSLDLVFETPETPGYKLINPPFGRGAYGRVWLARTPAKKWCAIKAIYLENFKNDTVPYDREFNGVSKYMPVSDKHPGLLRVDFVSPKMERYFYYVMELGDALKPGWERKPSEYKPRDLASERVQLPGRKMPVRDCVRIGLALSETLDFLHQQGLTHRDIKPPNVIYVNGQPKLADLGLISDIRPPDQEGTAVGTPGYMPPAPETPGTPQADIYALGIMLYVLCTGRDAASFPEFSETITHYKDLDLFMALNAVIAKACQRDPTERYSTAGEMYQALRDLEKEPPS
jgi:CHASE2 domain-containing sensor protein